ncbi:hypothetical protein ACCS79_03690 [Rhizobium johnstonii]|uniref:hypothetical protein n=1 Tax=Rhizobium johnstonii TaxID=3019933 RepID=UPI003F960CD8
MDIQTFVNAEAARLALMPMPRDPGERWRQRVYRQKIERLTGVKRPTAVKPRRRKLPTVVRDDFGWPEYGS